MLDPLGRLGDIRSLIDDKQYFFVHAPRQSGKTTTIDALAKQLTAEGHYTAIRFSCETGRAYGNNVEKVEDTFLYSLTAASKLHLSPELQCPDLDTIPKTNRIHSALRLWASSSPRPLVLFIDEIDAIFDESLLSILHQLRDGFSGRPHAFPHSVILCGLRDVRDYKVLSGGQQRLGTASPFNIKSDSLRLENFTEAQVSELYLQHTTETGQQFEPEALEKGWELSQGQPWLVNALANRVTRKMGIAPTQTITALDLEHAAQELIIERQTHLDSLVDKLSEDRVRRVIEPILAGEIVEADFSFNDDVSFVRDLGLIASKPPLRIANPIYREVIVRVLAGRPTEMIDFERRTFVTGDGRLDVPVILREFLSWWCEHGEFMMKTGYYQEAAAQLVFMAWLQRVVNGGGIIDREYGIGRGRIDVLVRWPLPGATPPAAWQREAFELKVWVDGKPDPLARGLEQLERYLDGLGLNHGTLVIFDRRNGAAPIAERSAISETETKKGYSVTVVRG